MGGMEGENEVSDNDADNFKCIHCAGTGLKLGVTDEMIKNCPIPDMLECDYCDGTGKSPQRKDRKR